MQENEYFSISLLHKVKEYTFVTFMHAYKEGRQPEVQPLMLKEDRRMLSLKLKMDERIMELKADLDSLELNTSINRSSLSH